LNGKGSIVTVPNRASGFVTRMSARAKSEDSLCGARGGKSMKRYVIPAVLLSAALVAGCARPIIYEGRYDYDEGWRRGVVHDVGTADTLGRSFRFDSACNNFQRPAKTQYALVKRTGHWGHRLHRHRRHQKRWRAVVVPGDLVIAPNDLVYFNIEDCNLPLELRSQ